MNIFRYIYEQYFAEFPKSETVDRSGIVKSDHPYNGNGWIKGWVIDCASRDLISVCKHSNPSLDVPNNRIFVLDNEGNKIERVIVRVYREKLVDYDNGMDVCICKVDTPFPESVKKYKFANKLRPEQLSITFNQRNVASFCNLKLNDILGEIKGSKRTLDLVAGDSGMPWFVWEDKEWRVATHTFRGKYGTGPYYSAPIIWQRLVNWLT